MVAEKKINLWSKNLVVESEPEDIAPEDTVLADCPRIEKRTDRTNVNDTSTISEITEQHKMVTAMPIGRTVVIVITSRSADHGSIWMRVSRKSASTVWRVFDCSVILHGDTWNVFDDVGQSFIAVGNLMPVPVN